MLVSQVCFRDRAWPRSLHGSMKTRHSLDPFCASFLYAEYPSTPTIGDHVELYSRDSLNNLDSKNRHVMAFYDLRKVSLSLLFDFLQQLQRLYSA